MQNVSLAFGKSGVISTFFITDLKKVDSPSVIRRNHNNQNPASGDFSFVFVNGRNARQNVFPETKSTFITDIPMKANE